MSSKVLGMNLETALSVLIILGLVTFGLVAFNYYVTVTTYNGIKFATGASVTLLPQKPRKEIIKEPTINPTEYY